jgi:hypothetical protein
MQPSPPRHLAPRHLAPQRPRALARDHLLAESLLAMLAIALTTALVIGSVLDRSGSSTVARLPNLPPTPPPTTAQAAAATTTPGGPAGNLLADPGFERGLDGWAALGGAGLGRVDDGRSGRFAASFAGGGKAPGMALGNVTTTRAHKAYAATVWVRSSAPGTTVEVNVVEYRGGRRYATDTGGAVLAGGGWERVEVAHDAHHPGDRLGIEVLAPGLAAGASLLVDDVAVVTEKASFMGMVAS